MTNEKYLEELDKTLIDLLGIISHYFRARRRKSGEYYFIALEEMKKEISKAKNLIEKIEDSKGENNGKNKGSR